MTRLLVTSASAIFLILFVAFVASRVVRSRTAGLSIRLQLFLALASIVGAFAVGLGLLVLDRLEARTTLIAEGAARDEAEAIATLVASEMESRDVELEDVAKRYDAPPPPSGRTDPRTKRGLALLDPSGRAVFSSGLTPDGAGHRLRHRADRRARRRSSAESASSSRRSSFAVSSRTSRPSSSS